MNAISGLGIVAVIAPSFGDIFRGNCVKNGIAPIVVADEAVASLMASADATPGAPFRVDLPRQLVFAPAREPMPFVIDAAVKQQLLSGEDDIVRTLREEDAISAFQARDRIARPWIWFHANV